MTYALYLSDEQIARRLGVSLGEWRANAVILERQGLPAGNPLFGGRRYWPALVRFLDRMEGLEPPSSVAARDGKEHWEEVADVRPRSRARIHKALAG